LFIHCMAMPNKYLHNQPFASQKACRFAVKKIFDMFFSSPEEHATNNMV